MVRRPPRSSAVPRPDHPITPAVNAPGRAAPGGPGDPVDAGPPRGEVPGDLTRADEGSAATDDTALLGAYALGALTAEERAAVEERLAASPALQDELRRLIPVAALLREATVGPARPLDRPVPHREPATAVGAASDDVTDRDDGPHDPAPDATPEAVAVRDRPPASTGSEPAVEPRQGLQPDDVTRTSVAAALPLVGDDPPPPATPGDGARSDEDSPVVRVEAAPSSPSSRPVGRRGGAAPAPSRTEPGRGRTATVVGSWPLSWVAAGLASLIAVGALLWALALVDRLDTRRAEIDGLRAELGELQARGDAASVPLAPVEGGPAGADGVALVVPSEGSLIVRVSGMPASAEGRAYQVWFQSAADAPDGGWIVGPVFQVGEDGAALVELPAAVPDFARLSISEEPSPGSGAPTGPFLLEGSVATPERE